LIHGQLRIRDKEKQRAQELGIALNQLKDEQHKTKQALLQAKKELFRSESTQYIDQIAAADKALEGNDLLGAQWHLEQCRSEFRHVEYAYLRKQLAQKAFTLGGHKEWVRSLALSSDGKRLVSGSWDDKGQTGEIKVWDLEPGKETFTLGGHAHQVTSLVLSSDGKRLVSGSFQQIKVWDLEAGKETLSLHGPKDVVSSLALSPDAKRLFSGSLDKTIKVWDLETGKETLTSRAGKEASQSIRAQPIAWADGPRQRGLFKMQRLLPPEPAVRGWGKANPRLEDQRYDGPASVGVRSTTARERHV
jgi:hypothetical protein